MLFLLFVVVTVFVLTIQTITHPTLRIRVSRGLDLSLSYRVPLQPDTRDTEITFETKKKYKVCPGPGFGC